MEGRRDIMHSMITSWAVELDCGDQTVRGHCRIFLPPQSPLGTYKDPQGQPSGMWPASFLCLRHGHLSIRNSNSVRLDIGDSPIPNFFRIEAECGLESCAKLHTLFAAGAPDSKDVIGRILSDRPAIACNGHDLIWKDNLVVVLQIYPDTPDLP